MPNDFFDDIFGGDDEPEYRTYDAGELQGVWDNALERSDYWNDYREDAQTELFDDFMDAFSRGGTRYGMEIWLVKMGIEDYEFDWAGWREANGY